MSTRLPHDPSGFCAFLLAPQILTLCSSPETSIFLELRVTRSRLGAHEVLTSPSISVAGFSRRFTTRRELGTGFRSVRTLW